MAHTPGPWHVGPKIDNWTHCSVCSWNPQGSSRLLIANIIDIESTVANNDDNARLIAAAPELLAACQQLVKHIALIKETWERDGEERNTKMHGLAVALNNRPGDLIFAAIAKATGKAVQHG